MGFIEGGKYQSSAAMGSSAQELSNGLLIDLVGFTILQTGQIIYWEDYNKPDKAQWLPALSKTQQTAINIYRAKYSLSSELYFIVLSDGTENLKPEPTQYTIKGNAAQKILESYNKHRYNLDSTEKNNFSFLDKFVTDYLVGRKLQIPHSMMPNVQINIVVEQVYQWSIPHSETKPLYKSKRGSRGKNRGGKR